jgi:hypothetical protein
MINLAKMRLGKLAARHDPRTLQFANYLLPEALSTNPPTVDWTTKVTQGWPMMRNDTVGDCTCAAAGHMIEEWTANATQIQIPSDDDIIKAYSAITGYNPDVPSSDRGAAEIEVLKYWQKTGIAGHSIEAYAALEPGNHDHVKAATYIFGGCYIGLGLPVSAQKQRVWSVPPGGPQGQGAPGSWGGHAVPVVGYDSVHVTVVTWGALKKMTWGFWDAYCDEAYAIISEDWLTAADRTPIGFDMAALQKDLKELGQTLSRD